MPPATPVAAILLDLDGTLLDTERLVMSAAATALAARCPGAALTPAAAAAALGRRPADAWAAVVAALGLDVDPAALHADSEKILREQWPSAVALPGAARLVAHLRACALPLALVTSTPRATFAAKTSGPGGAPFGVAAWRAVVTGDDVLAGKPAPEPYLAAAAALGVDPAACLVVEDSPAGAAAAEAAGMRCIVVGAGAKEHAADARAAAGVVATLPSLLDFDPLPFGLRPFADRVCDAVPLGDGAIHLDATVVRGFGRGSAALGIPTANLDPAAVAAALDSAVTGVFAAWARLGAGPVFPAATSIGFNPHFGDTPARTVEPWILAPPGALPTEFYGERLRLLVVAYIRPEAAFDGLDSLIARIHADAAVARAALAHPTLAGTAADPRLVGE